MARRKAKRRSERERLTLAVRAAAIVVRREEPTEFSRLIGSPGRTNIRIEGRAVSATGRPDRETLVLVYRQNSLTKNLGYALGGTTPWTVSADLPADQFADLMALVLADKLHSTEMCFDKIKWHKGTLLSIDFGTLPIPSERE